MKGYIILLFKSLILTEIIFLTGFFLLQFLLEGKIDFTYIVFHSLKSSIIISFFLLILQLIFIKKNTGKFNYVTVNQNYILNLKNIKDLNKLANKITNNLNWKIEEQNNKQIIFKSSMNGIFSYGERIQIEILDQKEFDTQIKITSSPVFKLSVFDFAKNYKNVQQVKALLF